MMLCARICDLFFFEAEEYYVQYVQLVLLRTYCTEHNTTPSLILSIQHREIYDSCYKIEERAEQLGIV